MNSSEKRNYFRYPNRNYSSENGRVMRRKENITIKNIIYIISVEKLKTEIITWQHKLRIGGHPL
jgi:hypothetical protein